MCDPTELCFENAMKCKSNKIHCIVSYQTVLRVKEVGEGFPIITAFSKMAQNGFTVCLSCDTLHEICFNMHYLCCSYANECFILLNLLQVPELCVHLQNITK